MALKRKLPPPPEVAAANINLRLLTAQERYTLLPVLLVAASVPLISPKYPPATSAFSLVSKRGMVSEAERRIAPIGTVWR